MERQHRSIQYSRQTVAAYNAVIETGLGSTPKKRDESLRYLATMVHCDMTGELRGPRPYPDWWPDHLKQFSDGGAEHRPVVTDSKGNGLYADEVCDVGTCCRPPGHSGRHDQFDGPRSADSVPFHHIGSSE